MKRLFAVAAISVFAPCAAYAAETAAPATSTPAAASAPAATPASESGGGQRWAACAADLEKFCPAIERARGAKRTCLESHASELSDGCKARMAEKRPSPSAAKP